MYMVNLGKRLLVISVWSTEQDCKIQFQGANKTDKAIERIGRAIDTLSAVLDHFDNHNLVPSTSSIQTKPDAQKDMLVVVRPHKVNY